MGGRATLPVILLHGFAHTPASWAEVVAALAADHVDLRPTPLPGHDPTVPVAATWDASLAALATRLPADAIAVGYSYGARVALGLLARASVRAAILIGVNPGLADAGERAARRAADAVWATRLRTVGTAAFLDAWEAQPLFASQQRAPAEVRARRRAARAALDAEGLARALEVLGLGAMPDLAPALATHAARIHLMVGADDLRFRTIAAAVAARATVAVDLVAASGHDPTLEAPAALATLVARALVRLA